MDVPREILDRFEQSFSNHRNVIEENTDDGNKVSIEVYPGGPVFEGDKEDVKFRTWLDAPPPTYFKVYAAKDGVSHYIDIKEVDPLTDNIESFLSGGGIKDKKVRAICGEVLDGFYIPKEPTQGELEEACTQCDNKYCRDR